MPKIEEDKFIGCLMGGAAGDALGYAVEFDDIASIRHRYGMPGITEYQRVGGVAQISDDTQMTLFTAQALLDAEKAGITMQEKIGWTQMDDYLPFIHRAYREWALMQMFEYPLIGVEGLSALSAIPELYAARAPGMTCMNSLRQDTPGTIEDPINNSKGCGGVMRIAPISLFFEDWTGSLLAAKASALTHGHPLGYIPSAILSEIIRNGVSRVPKPLPEAIRNGVQMAEILFRNHPDEMQTMSKLIDLAIKLAETATDDLAAIQQLGEGWVAEETLAIAIYCALKYPGDFEKAIVASVNHSGDSDSTGAVTGNILGAYLGRSAIPEKFQEGLELKELIVEMGKKLYQGRIKAR